MSSFIEDLTDYVGTLRFNGQAAYSLPFHWVILTNGAAEYQDSVILFGFEQGKCSPSLVVKTPRMPANGWVMQTEYARLVELWKFLGSSASQRLPQPIALAAFHRQTALILSYVQGESLVRVSKKALWNDPQEVRRLSVEAARAYREIIDRTATPLAEGEHLPQDFSQKAEKFKQTYTLTEMETKILADLVEKVEANQAAASRKVLIQGDFWHGNIIRGRQHDQLIFIDWQYARWTTDVSLDVYLFLLAGAQGAAFSTSGEERVKGAVAVLLAWKNDVIPAYLAAFGKPEGVALLPTREGMLACCVEMAVRIKMGFGYNHVNDILWRLLYSELTKLPEDF